MAGTVLALLVSFGNKSLQVLCCSISLLHHADHLRQLLHHGGDLKLLLLCAIKHKVKLQVLGTESSQIKTINKKREQMVTSELLQLFTFS